MKRWLLHIWLTGVLGILAASCSQVIDDPVTGDCVMEKEKVMIRFTIALDSPKMASRTWEGYDQDDNINEEDELLGSENENYIDPATVQVWIYDLNGVLIGQLKDLAVTRDDTSKGMHVYDLVGGFEVNGDFITNNKLSFKLMVFANCEPISNLNNLENLTFTNPSTTTGKGIPMWGIATYTDADVYTTVAQAQSNPLTTPIYMLRSMAKIEVALDPSMTGYTLTEATLSKAMNSGYVLPALKDATGAAKTLANLTATTQLGVDEVFHPVAETANNFTSNVTFTASSNTCVIYVPEYNNNTSEDLTINLTGLKKGNNVVYKDETQQTAYSFKHGEYNDETGMFISKLNVTRNHYYKYEVTIKDGNQLALTCQVQPWTLDQEILDYETFVSVSQVITPIVGTIYDNAVVMVDKTVSENYKVKMAQVEFTILTPQGYTWYASLIADDEGKAFGFAELDEDDNLIVDSTTGKVATTAIASGKVGTKSTLTIVSEHTGLQNAISSRLQIVVRDDNTGHTYVVKDDVLTGSGSYYIVQNP